MYGGTSRAISSLASTLHLGLSAAALCEGGSSTKVHFLGLGIAKLDLASRCIHRRQAVVLIFLTNHNLCVIFMIVNDII